MTNTIEAPTAPEQDSEIVMPAAVIESDGLLIDTATGEVIGFVAPDGGQVTDESTEQVITEDYANWVLRRMLARKAKIHAANIAASEAKAMQEAVVKEYQAKVALDPRYIEASMVMVNCDNIIRREGRELDWFMNRFKDALAAFADKMLSGKRARTWSSPFGALKLAHKAERLAIQDEPKFCRWALKHCPEAVKLSGLVSKVPKTTLAIPDIEADGDEEAIDGNGLVVIPECDELTIVVGAA